MAGSFEKSLALALLLLQAAVAELEWWKRGPIYQVYPTSFADSNGDGWGDFQGITDHAEHLSEIGVVAVWLSPIYKSPMIDNGYDVSNYTDVNPIFGTLKDVDTLIGAYHKKGIKVVLDFVPNHTSNTSTWFLDSLNRRNGKDDWYVWKEPKGYNAVGEPIPPNNWLSTFGDTKSSAWKFEPSRKQFYYHVFGEYQVDLNYENKDVREAVKECIRFWLRKGVDGFRMDAVPFLVETDFDQDEPWIPGCEPAGTYQCLDHTHTMNRKGTHDVLDEFDAVLREPEFTKGGDVRAQWVEAYVNSSLLPSYYGQVSSPFNFQYITYITRNSNASEFRRLTMDYFDKLQGKWPNWVVGNHDNSRVGTRMGPDMIDTMTILTQLMPGTSITYYGEEIGMTDLENIQPSQRKDNTSITTRDPERTPMQWNSSINAGFSNTTDSNKLYLPVNPNFDQTNVDAEKKKSPNSHLDIYKAAVKLHQQYNVYTQLKTATHGNWVIAFHRPDAQLLIVINLNDIEESLKIKDFALENVDKKWKVIISSLNSNQTTDTNIDADQQLLLNPRSSIVLLKTNGGNSLRISSVLWACLGLLTYLRH